MVLIVWGWECCGMFSWCVSFSKVNCIGRTCCGTMGNHPFWVPKHCGRLPVGRVKCFLTHGASWLQKFIRLNFWLGFKLFTPFILSFNWTCTYIYINTTIRKHPVGYMTYIFFIYLQHTVDFPIIIFKAWLLGLSSQVAHFATRLVSSWHITIDSGRPTEVVSSCLGCN